MLKKRQKYFITFIIFQLVISLFYLFPSLSEVVEGEVGDIVATVNFDSPFNNGINVKLNNNEVTVSGDIKTVTGSNPVSGATLKFLDNNGVEKGNTTSSADGKWTVTFNDVNDGVYSYKISANGYDLGSPVPEINFTVDTTGPALKIDSPRVQTKNVIITGTVIDKFTSNDKMIMELYNNIDPDNPTKINDVIIIGPTLINNQWNFSFLTEFPEGPYNYKVRAKDELGNYSDVNYNFNAGEMPAVSSIEVSYADIDKTTGNRITPVIDLLKNENMNKVVNNTSIKVTIKDNLITESTIKNPIEVTDSSGVKVDGPAPTINIVNNEVTITFTPTLVAGKTYYVRINPYYIDKDTENNTQWTTDASGNPLLPVIRRFTTEKESDSTKIPEDKKIYHNLNDPHGNVGTNTNTCGNCHRTHDSKVGPNLEQPSFEYSTYNYCMACHDGTVAPNPENIHENSHFPGYANPGVKKMASDCSSCHSSHLTWSKENPNLLKSRFVYLHDDEQKMDNQNYPYGDIEGEEIDSLIQPCETCHDENAQKVKDQYVYTHNNTDKMNDNENYPDYPDGRNFDSLSLNENERCEYCHENITRLVKDYESVNPDNQIAVNYKILHYRNSTATGLPDDYQLCFRCHDGTKKWTDENDVEHTITNIKQYYNIGTDTSDKTNSNLSMHRITAIDGSSLIKNVGANSNDGHIPCAECHDTHGSTNIKILRNKFGHENRDNNEFAAVGGIWDGAKERSLCIKCHNGSTGLYGVIGKTLNESITEEHKKSDTTPCSTCHGIGTTAEEKALSAAHAPTAGVKP